MDVTVMMEHVVTFGETNSLVGILTDSQPGATLSPSVAVILLNAGIVHRVGPSRLYVRLARRLAARGLPVVRFDHGGVGDSERGTHNLPFEQAYVLEVKQVMDQLEARHGVERFILIGICSGAITAFQASLEDSRIAGAVMMNAQAFASNEQWNTYVLNRGWARDYWTRSLLRPSSWWRALTGRIQYRRLAAVLGRQVRGLFGRGEAVNAQADEIAGKLRDLIARQVRLLMIYTEGDHGLDIIDVILGKNREALTASGMMHCEVISDCDHTFTLERDQQRVYDHIDQWMPVVVNQRGTMR